MARGSDVHYLRLRDDLIGGRFPPGTVLLETVLSERYGVPRTPIREALGRLAQDGFIDRLTRGFRVRRRTPDEILQIYEARIALEAGTAAFATQRHSAFDLARLDYLAEQRRTATNPATFAGLNNEWHEALRAAAHNEITSRFLAQLDSLLRIYQLAPAPIAVHDATVEEHDAILAAVRQGDAEAAQTAMSHHLARMRDLRVAALAQATG